MRILHILQRDRLWLRYNLVLCATLRNAMGKRRFCSLEEFACSVSTWWGAACKLFVSKCSLNLTLYSFEVPQAYAGCFMVGSLDRPLGTNCALDLKIRPVQNSRTPSEHLQVISVILKILLLILKILRGRQDVY